ncbi:MAG: OmpA family protein, partial [Cyclobacteriaceae bacterium]|nr:OmpA family protein [Cyclobacteriaceae bacterium]
NGNKMIFTRNNYVDQKYGKSEDGVNKLKLFYAEWNDDNWSKATPLSFNRDNYSYGHPTISSDGKMLIFASDMLGSLGETDLFISYFENGNWTEPQNLGSRINTQGREMFPYLYNDHILFFASAGHGGLGGLDVFRIDLNDKDNAPIKNMGYPINSSKDDFGLILDSEMTVGYFSSNRNNGPTDDDIYKVVFKQKEDNILFVQNDLKSTSDGAFEVVDQKNQEKQQITEITEETEVQSDDSSKVLAEKTNQDATGSEENNSLSKESKTAGNSGDSGQEQLNIEPKNPSSGESASKEETEVQSDDSSKALAEKTNQDATGSEENNSLSKESKTAGNSGDSGQEQLNIEPKNPSSGESASKEETVGQSDDSSKVLVEKTNEDPTGSEENNNLIKESKTAGNSGDPGQEQLNIEPKNPSSGESASKEETVGQSDDSSKVLAEKTNQDPTGSEENNNLSKESKSAGNSGDSDQEQLNIESNIDEKNNEITNTKTSPAEKSKENSIERKLASLYPMDKWEENTADGTGKSVNEDSAQKVKREISVSEIDKFELSEGWMKDSKVLFVGSIYYDFDKYNIREDAIPNLKEVVEILQKYPTIRILFSSHTDSRGSINYNNILSKKRAASVINYILSHDFISEEQLIIDYSGELKLSQQCPTLNSCTEEQHQQNRRTEITLILDK